MAGRKVKKNAHQNKEQEWISKIMTRIENSPTAYHIIANMSNALDEKGFIELSERDSWRLSPGENYYVKRNGSSIIAFSIPVKASLGYRIVASHSDSPSFRIKENPEIESAGYIRLNVEKYGGMLCAPWFDRPLSIAGRVLVRTDHGKTEKIETRLVNIDKDLLMLPSLAIHMNRDANDGVKFSAQKDMLPVMGEAADKTKLKSMIAESIGVKETDILGEDLFLYVRQSPVIWGDHGQYISSPRLDDQECAWCSLEAIFAASNRTQTMVHCVFDNEEVGSRTKQGAASTFLQDTLYRINMALGNNQEDYFKSIAESFMISADNAHAVHPAYPDKADPVHKPRMNEGIVLKFSANQNYTTDGVSAAVVRQICEKNNIPLQTFFNNSDSPGGSTLGNIANAHVSLNAADIGLAQLAMHSPYETAGTYDIPYMVSFMKEYYGMEDLGVNG